MNVIYYQRAPEVPAHQHLIAILKDTTMQLYALAFIYGLAFGLYCL